jgi:hypothetical protein
MGREKYDNCSNCNNVTYDRKTDTYTCKLDKSNVKKDDWCKHHDSNEDQ